MKKYLLILSIPILLVCSCQKDKAPALLHPVADYIPTAAGSTWVYNVGDGTGHSYGTFTVTATAEPVQKDGRTFSVLSGGSILPGGGDKSYFYKTPGQYKTYYTVVHDDATGIDFDVPILLNRITLNKDTTYFIPAADVSKPAPWQVQCINGNQNYQDVTINGKAYDNCIVTITNILKYNDDPKSAYYGTYEVYDTYAFTFAPNIGIIEVASNYQINTLISSDLK